MQIRIIRSYQRERISRYERTLNQNEVNIDFSEDGNVKVQGATVTFEGSIVDASSERIQEAKDAVQEAFRRPDGMPIPGIEARL